MEKRFEIKNKEGQKIVGLINFPESQRKAAVPIILCHGFKGYMAQPFLRIGAEFLSNNGYTVFRFDATNGIGESGGDIYNCTVTHYVEDLLSVVDYVAGISGLDLDRLTVFGTSMGGLVVTIAASKNRRIRVLVTHSAAFDWRILLAHPDIDHGVLGVEKGKEIAFVSKSKGITFKVSYNLYNDGIKYDAYRLLSRLTIPTLLLHSGRDEAIPLESSRKALAASKGEPKELSTIPEASHSPSDESLIRSIFAKIDAFLKSLFSVIPA